MAAVKHDVVSAKSRKTRRAGYEGRTVYTVACTCGLKFESVNSEAHARSYQSAHRKLSNQGST